MNSSSGQGRGLWCIPTPSGKPGKVARTFYHLPITVTVTTPHTLAAGHQLELKLVASRPMTQRPTLRSCESARLGDLRGRRR